VGTESFVKSGPGLFGLRGRDPETQSKPAGADKSAKGKSDAAATGDGEGFRAWMFQATPPLRSRSRGADHRDEEWNAPVYRDRLTPGDPAIFMVVGSHAGIHVTGRIAGLPFQGVDELGKPGWRVKGRVGDLVKPALAREEVLRGPGAVSLVPVRGLPARSSPSPLGHLRSAGACAFESRV